MKSIEDIRKAFSKVWRVATNQAEEALMSIPVDRERDADCIVHDAISELERLRAENERLKAAADRLVEISIENYKRGARRMAEIAERHWIGDEDEERNRSIKRLMKLLEEGQQ